MTISTAQAAGGTKAGVILPGALRAVYGREILQRAQPNLLFAQLADRITDLQREKGDAIKFTRIEDLKGSADLSEVENVTIHNMDASEVSVTVDEYGYGIGMSDRLLRTSFLPNMAIATQQLGRHYGKFVDGKIRDAFRASGILHPVFPSLHTRLTLASTDTMNVKAIKDAVEYLATAKIAKVGDAYIGIVDPHQARGLRDDDEWISANQYAGSQAIFRGEIGMIEGVRFLSTTMLTQIKTDGSVWADGEDTGQDEAVFNVTYPVHQGMICGANAVGWATAMPVELRDNGVIDFNRTRQLAWLSIEGWGSVNTEAVVIVETV